MSKGLLQSTLSITDIRARNCVDKSTQPIINKTHKENLVLISRVKKTKEYMLLPLISMYLKSDASLISLDESKDM